MRVSVTLIAAAGRLGYLIRDRFWVLAPVIVVHASMAGVRNLQKGPENDGRNDISVGRGDVGIRRKVVRCSTLRVFTSATRHD
jgi:hypothetical protein